MQYHIRRGMLVAVDDEGQVTIVADDQGAYTLEDNKSGRRGASWSYVRGNVQAITRGARPIKTAALTILPTAILVDTDRGYGIRKHYHGWHICGGAPCYVDKDGNIQCIYHDGVLIEVCRRKSFSRLPFEAWKFVIGSQSADILIEAALSAESAMQVIVRPCQFRERGVYTYDNA